VHGLRSVQIARSLGRSPETVRTQVRRGLEHLRRLLPKGLAVPVALFAVRGRGLAAVRSTVLAQARAAVAPVTAFSGAWLLVVLAAVWAVGSSLWVSTGRATTASVPAVAVAGHEQDTTAAVQTASRVAVPAPVRPAAPAAGGAVSALAPGRIRGRCVADESGEPIAGARVWLGGPPAFAVVSESGSDGGSSSSFRATDATEVILTLDGAGRARLACSFAKWSPGQELDLGEVRMPHGVELRGQIRDGEGRPVAGFLSLRNTSLPRTGLPVGNQPAITGGTSRSAQAEDAGRFVVDGLLEPGNWAIEVIHRTVVGPRTVAIASHEREHELQVVVAAQDPARAIHGRVVDERGQPFRSVRVALQDPNGERTFDGRRSTSTASSSCRTRRAFRSSRLCSSHVTTPGRAQGRAPRSRGGPGTCCSRSRASRSSSSRRPRSRSKWWTRRERRSRTSRCGAAPTRARARASAPSWAPCAWPGTILAVAWC